MWHSLKYATVMPWVYYQFSLYGYILKPMNSLRTKFKILYAKYSLGTGKNSNYSFHRTYSLVKIDK